MKQHIISVRHNGKLVPFLINNAVTGPDGKTRVSSSTWLKICRAIGAQRGETVSVG